MKKLVFAMMLMGCSASDVTPDPGVAAPVAPHDVPSGLCCQLTWYADPYWGAQRYECDRDSGPDYSNIPWLCNAAPDATADLLDCHNPSCVTGMPCRGENGWGVVLECDQVVW